MPINRYDKALKLIQDLKKTYHGNEIKFDDLVMEIRKRIGDDDIQTVQPYIKLMKDHNLVTQIGDTDMVKLGGEDAAE